MVASPEKQAPRRWLIFLASLLIVLLSGGVYSLWSLSAASQRAAHTDRVRLDIAGLLKTVTNAETGARGYVVAGEHAFLDLYEQAVLDWKPELAALRALVADNPAQLDRLDRLEQLIGTRFDFLTRLRAQFDSGQRAAELTPIMLDGKRTMDAARSIFDEMESEEVRLDDIRQTKKARDSQITFVLLASGAIAFIAMLGVMFLQRRDAEARRLRTEEVTRANALFEIVLAGTDMGITVQDKSGALVYANAAGAAIVGFDSARALLEASTSEVLARFELLDDDGAPLPIAKLPSRAALRGESPDELPIRFRPRGSRELRRSLLRSVPSRDAFGEVAFVINFFREVTEKARRDEQRVFLLRAADELNSSLDYERTLAAVTRMAVPSLADWCAVDLVVDGNVKRVAVAHVDPAKLTFIEELERRYPSDPSSATGVPQIIRSGKAEFMAEIPRALIQAAAIDAEHLRLIDSLQLYSYIGVPLTVRGSTVGAITLAMAESGRRYTQNDLEFAEALADRAALAIENARLFRELEKASVATQALLESETLRRTDAENAARFADVFIGILGHDLRNPLNAVMMGAQLMRHRPADAKTLDRIESSTRRMSAMVMQLLDLTRSRIGGGIDIARARTDLAAVVNGVVDELRLVHPTREIQVEIEQTWGHWDGGRLAQVVSNLVGNAVEHGDPAKPISIRLVQTRDEIRVAIRNEGSPIPPELLPTLFDPYRRITARGAGSKGLGLGLFITQQIVLAHGGRIDVHSDATGTTFAMVLPHVPDTRATVFEEQLS